MALKQVWRLRSLPKTPPLLFRAVSSSPINPEQASSAVSQAPPPAISQSEIRILVSCPLPVLERLYSSSPSFVQLRQICRHTLDRPASKIIIGTFHFFAIHPSFIPSIPVCVRPDAKLDSAHPYLFLTWHFASILAPSRQVCASGLYRLAATCENTNCQTGCSTTHPCTKLALPLITAHTVSSPWTTPPFTPRLVAKRHICLSVFTRRDSLPPRHFLIVKCRESRRCASISTASQSASRPASVNVLGPFFLSALGQRETHPGSP